MVSGLHLVSASALLLSNTAVLSSGLVAYKEV